MKEQQAFPTIINSEVSRGMTLRDYFAAAIITGIFAHRDNVFNTHLMNATEAYQMADAMMHARKGGSMNLYQRWIDAKEAEKAAIELRRAIEDELVMDLDIAKTLDGTQNIETDGYKVKVVGRLDRKVNSDKLQDLAAEFGLTQHLSSLFRWKPEVNASAWKSADVSITEVLQDAITTTNGRPSFTIIKE